eukprot:5290580-Alexandrium_andersonii.AAC.1
MLQHAAPQSRTAWPDSFVHPVALQRIARRRVFPLYPELPPAVPRRIVLQHPVLRRSTRPRPAMH